MADVKLPILAVDFSKSVDHNVFYPLTDASMANALGGPEAGWSAERVRLVNAQHGILATLPRRCPGKQNCSVAQDCPFTNEVVNDEFLDSNCPVEVVEAFKLFAGYVIDLDIQPDDFTDLQLVRDLIRLTLLACRCDATCKDGEILTKEAIMLNNRTGEHIEKSVPVPTFAMMREIREDIQKIYTLLVASREAKAKRDAMLKDNKGASDWFNQLKDMANKLDKDKPKSKKRDTPINAEFTVDDSTEETDSDE